MGRVLLGTDPPATAAVCTPAQKPVCHRNRPDRSRRKHRAGCDHTQRNHPTARCNLRSIHALATAGELGPFLIILALLLLPRPLGVVIGDALLLVAVAFRLLRLLRCAGELVGWASPVWKRALPRAPCVLTRAC